MKKKKISLDEKWSKQNEFLSELNRCKSVYVHEAEHEQGFPVQSEQVCMCAQQMCVGL